jgi:transposase
MPVPLAPQVTLAEAEQTRLESIVRAHSTPQALAFRCQLILRAAAPDHPSNLQVAQELHCNRHTVGRWRSRYLAQGLSGLQDAPRLGRPRRFSPSARLDVLSMATRKPARYHCPATRWSLDDLVTALAQERPWLMSRSSIWRLLDDADLKPHRSVYWLNSHDPDFEPKAHDICALYVHALRYLEQSRLVICSDEKTGMQILQRKYPTQPVTPGKPEKREHEYIRHGVRALMASFVVATGQVVWNLGQTRTSADFATHLATVVQQLPAMPRYDWVVDNLNTHWSSDVCRLVAQWCKVPCVAQDLRRGVQRRAFLSDPTHKHVFHFTPKHGSWLNQVELWFSVLARRFLKRGDFAAAHDFETRLFDYLEVYNTHHAHPYRWTYTGQPLVRATPFSRTRRQQRQGRAWFSSRPKCFERVLYPPRPYKRVAA